MKILMIAVNGIDSKSSPGVSKKLLGQYHAFQSLGEDVYFLTYSDSNTVLLHEKEENILFANKNNGYVSNISLFNVAPSICKKYHIDCCYIRFALSDWSFIRMLRRLSVLSKVVVEIPTYPYDEENKKYTNLVSRFNYIQDRFLRRQWKMYVNRVVTFSDDKEIFGIPCININNGIDVGAVKYVGDELNYDGDVTLISVALMRPSHGYDRVIAGMAKYYHENIMPERIIHYLVVGNGPDTDHLQQMVHENHLESYVKFCGVQSGQELDKLFRQSNIGIAVLAGHRDGLESVSDLKSREYCARGIPFITANSDKAIPKDSIFLKAVQMNDKPIDMVEIIRFFDYIKEQKEIHHICREYAERYFCWEHQMRKVVREVEEEM